MVSPYTHLGCWGDRVNSRAVPKLDGSDSRLKDNYGQRKDAINKCFEVARERKMIIFAIQAGGWCAGDDNLNGYKKYGSSTACKDGKGGPEANDVYQISHPIEGL